MKEQYSSTITFFEYIEDDNFPYLTGFSLELGNYLKIVMCLPGLTKCYVDVQKKNWTIQLTRQLPDAKTT